MEITSQAVKNRKRSSSMITPEAGSRLGSLTSSPRRSDRYSKHPRPLSIPPEASIRPIEPAPSSSKIRTWNATALGSKVSSGEYVVKASDTVFSVMSYNVLADELMQRHSNLYNISIEDDVMRWDTRFERLKQEIIHYDCDILCCQEVQEIHFHSHFRPSLNQMGFEAVYKKRTGDKSDGCAIFYKIDKVIQHLTFLAHIT